MTRPSPTKFLEDAVRLLVTHFGAASVWTALAKVAPHGGILGKTSSTEKLVEKRPSRPTIDSLLRPLKASDPNRYQYLQDFLVRLRERRVLPDAEDFRQFAQRVGIKELKGKSRRDMIPSLMIFLMSVPSESLPSVLSKAEGISEAMRKTGYSVLTDKLMKRE